MDSNTSSRIGLLEELFNESYAVFEEEGVASVAGDNLQLLRGWIEKGRAGEPLAVVSPVCPDYSVESADDRQQRRYTFDRMSTGIGPMAAVLYRSLTRLHAVFSDYWKMPRFEHFICVCDFDGFYENNLRRLGVNEAQFRTNVLATCESLTRQAPAGITASLLSDHCGGKAGWLTELSATRKRLAQIEGGSEWELDAIRAIARDRSALYQRWLGEQRNDSLIEVLVTAQGIEYATAG
jgi:hypothetical protein